MKKMLSLTLMAALSVMLAYGVTLAAGGDRAYGQGTVTVSEDRSQPTPNDVWMVVENSGIQFGDWSKSNTILGDPTLTPDQADVSHVLLLKNKKSVECLDSDSCPTENISKSQYKLMIDTYSAQNFKAEPIQEVDPVEIKVVDISDGKVIYEGDLANLETLPFDVGYTYVDMLNNNSIIHEDITELEFTFYYPTNAVDVYIEYSIVAQELPPAL